LLNLLFTSQEKKNVSRPFIDMDLHHSLDGCREIVLLRCLGVEDLYREHAAWYIEEG